MSLAKEILEGMYFLIIKHINNAPFDKTYSGVIVAINPNNIYSVKINNNIYNFPVNGNKTFVVNQTVYVLYPQNNISNGFIL